MNPSKTQVHLGKQRIELENKLIEVQIREKEKALASKQRINQSLLIAVIGAIIGILGTLINTIIQHNNEIQLEKQKLNSSLILKAIESNDNLQSISTLKFLLALNLISDEGDSLKRMLSDPDNFRNIPALLANRSFITITDSTGKRLEDVDVFYNKIFIGKTSKNGQVTAVISKVNPSVGDIEVLKGGIEYSYVDIFTNASDSITLRVIPR